MRRTQTLAFGLALISLLWLPAAARRARDTRAAAASPPPQTRKKTAAQATPVVREIDFEGLKKILARQGKPARALLVNFWATWCEPCRDEFPDLVQIDKDYSSRGLEFVTVSLDDPTDIKSGVPQFLQEMRARMPAYLLNVPDPEPVINWIDAAWTGGLPATYLYDARGQIVFKHVGRVKPEELRAALEKVTGGK